MLLGRNEFGLGIKVQTFMGQIGFAMFRAPMVDPCNRANIAPKVTVTNLTPLVMITYNKDPTFYFNFIIVPKVTVSAKIRCMAYGLDHR